jgi:cytidine deaminase
VSAEIIITQRVFYKGNGDLKKANILSFGFNMMGDVEGNEQGIHAEHDAINRLKPLKRNKRLQSINILVIRLSKSNRIQQSKPCANCIQTMKTLPEKKGYKIRNIYYSDNNGEIVKSNIRTLEMEEAHISRFFRRNPKTIKDLKQ